MRSASIPGSETREEGGRKFTIFKVPCPMPIVLAPMVCRVRSAQAWGQREQVELRSEIGPWIVWRRFRQFHELDTKLRERCLPLEHLLS